MSMVTEAEKLAVRKSFRARQHELASVQLHSGKNIEVHDGVRRLASLNVFRHLLHSPQAQICQAPAHMGLHLTQDSLLTRPFTAKLHSDNKTVKQGQSCNKK